MVSKKYTCPNFASESQTDTLKCVLNLSSMLSFLIWNLEVQHSDMLNAGTHVSCGMKLSHLVWAKFYTLCQNHPLSTLVSNIICINSLIQT